MTLTRTKYKRLPDLYAIGTEVVLLDGTVVYLRALNPFERDEALKDAQTARSRMVMALKSGHATDERVRVTGAFLGEGRTAAIERLADGKASLKLGEIVNDVRSDPEWTERLQIMDRSEELQARPVEDAERALLEEINAAFIDEILTRQEAERTYLLERYGSFDEPALIEDYIDYYIERRSNDVAQAEYALTELWYAARCCEGVESDGQWDHEACEHHDVRIYDSKEEVRSQPEALQKVLQDAIAELNVTERDAHFSPRQGSSSDSSPLPSEAAASTPSTPDVTLADAPGTSPPLSVTP